MQDYGYQYQAVQPHGVAMIVLVLMLIPILFIAKAAQAWAGHVEWRHRKYGKAGV